MRKHGFVSADTLLEMADKALGEAEMKFWLVLDRLDVAFSDSHAFEGNALPALFLVYRDMVALGNISLKFSYGTTYEQCESGPRNRRSTSNGIEATLLCARGRQRYMVMRAKRFVGVLEHKQ